MTKKFVFFVLAILLIINAGTLKAQAQQQGSHFTGKKVFKANSISAASVQLPELSSDQRKSVRSAVMIVKVRTGTFHQFSNLDFSYTVSFDVAPAAWFEQSSYSLTVSNSKPQAALARNIAPYASGNGSFVNGLAPVTAIGISDIGVSGPATVSGISVSDSIQIELEYDIEYALDIKKETSPQTLTDAPGSLLAAGSGKVYVFSWDNAGYPYPNYEFQLLRLYNISDDSVADEKLITANPDWSKALTLETQSHETSVSLTIAEGQGYYLWRVRPVGSYYEGGIANDKNYSDQQWSAHQGAGVVNVTPAYDEANAHCFFFTDPDYGVNHIYSRIFTEKNRIRENITYANGLQQVKQTQTYLPSKDTTLIIQNIQDHSGRTALTTMPVPVNGELSGYRKNFVKSEETGALYTPDDFDQDTNYQNPSRILQSGTDFNYYSNDNPDRQIPDAEGFPFTRVLFYDDGTNRVKEQSGVGRMHMIGDSLPGHGGGKTVKTFYGAPSETELIRLFGDEAPDNESVVKTITVDQNNTASVTYTSKEGHVIATSLVTQAADNAGAGQTFDSLGFEPSGFEVTDTLRTRQLTPTGILSSKRLVFLDETEVQLDYVINCKTLKEQCVDFTVDCGFAVKVSIHSLDDPARDTILNEVPLSGPCSGGVQTASWPAITLPAGSYIVEKHLIASADPQLKAEGAREKIEAQIRPLTNMIKGWLADATCDEMIDTFYVKLWELGKDFQKRDSSDMSNSELDNKYRSQLGIHPDSSFFTSEHTLTIAHRDSVPVEVYISSPCCRFMKVSVEYFPLFRCDSTALHDWNEDDSLTVNLDYFERPDTSEFTPDFEGYAVQLLLACPGIPTGEAALDTLQKYMNGWKPGEFNLMVYKMLTDRYTCEGLEFKDSVTIDSTLHNDPGQRQEVLCGDTVTVDPDCGAGGCVQYNCRDLYACWIAQITALRESICTGFLEDVNGDTPYNPSDKFDEENGGDQGPHDNHFDDNIKGNFIVKWIAKKKISKRMRDLTVDPGGSSEGPAIPVAFKKHLVNEFLQCTGFKFAKILIPSDPEPLPYDTDISLTYRVPALDTVPNPIRHRKYMPQKNWAAYSLEDLDAEGKPEAGAKNLFPYIKDPVYAFKYYEYHENRPQLEFSVCFDDPNDCWDSTANMKVPCCAEWNGSTYDYTDCYKARIDMYPNMAEVKDGNDGADFKYIVPEFCDFGRVACPLTHEDWTCGQRYAFYEMLRSFVDAPDSFYTEEVLTCQDLTTPESPSGVSEVEYQMTTMTSGCKNTCEERRWEFEMALRKLLSDKCYIIGPCKDQTTPHIIPEKDFYTMVDSIVAMCKGQCGITTYSCASNECRLYTESKYNFGKSLSEGIPVERARLELGVGGGAGDVCPGGDCSLDLTHTYCELTRYKQATSWHFEIDIDSQCNPAEVAACSDTEVNCPPAGSANPDLQSLGKMPGVGSKTPFTPEYSNTFKIDVQVDP